MNKSALRIAVTGASGYIGRCLISRLDATPGVESVLAIDVRPPPPGAFGDKVTFVTHDISEPFSELLSRHNVESVVHLAYVMRPSRNQESARRVNVDGTINLLNACVAAKVTRLVYLSSTTVYGAYEDNPEILTEDAVPRPLKGYQYSTDKITAESLIGQFAHAYSEASVTILRGCPVLGPNADNYVAASFRRPILLAFNGSDPPMQFIHEDDLTEVIVRSLDRNEPGLYNVAGDGIVHWREVGNILGRPVLSLPAALLYTLTSATWAMRMQSVSPATGLDLIRYHWNVDTAKIKNELSVTFKSSYEALETFSQGIV